MADKMMKEGVEQMQDFFAKSIQDFREAQEKWFSTLPQGQSFSTDKFGLQVQQAMDAGRDHADAVMESGNILGDATREMTETMYQYANKSFSKQLEYSKEMLGCRTINDALDLQNRFMQSNMEDLFNETLKLSDMTFKTVQDAVEPIQEQANEAATKLYKSAA